MFSRCLISNIRALSQSVLAFSGAILFLGSAQAFETPTLETQRLEVAGMLLGSMDSSLQAIENNDYFDVTLRHCEVQVEGATLPSEYLLVLQSISTAEAPYRVRVTHLQADTAENAIASTNYLLAPGLNVNQWCNKPLSERKLRKDDLVVNRCTTYLRKSGDLFKGGTLGDGCPSDIRGAVRVTNVVELGKSHMLSWDRGWKSDGTQAWGAVAGPYNFRRVKLEKQDPLLAQLASFMTGRLSNNEQVEQDPENFSPVSYHICQVDGGTKLRPTTRLLLAKQIIEAPGRTITRNRIYKLVRSATDTAGDKIKEGVFEISASPFDETKIDPELCNSTLKNRLSVDTSSIQWDTSCTMLFRYDANSKSYIGNTQGEGCPSTFRGAVKMVADETISDGVIAPWERWYDASGNQVAGSTKGPYIYKRLGKAQE
jgi:CpeT protein